MGTFEMNAFHKSQGKVLPFSKILSQLFASRNMSLKEASEFTGVRKSVLHGWLCGAKPQDVFTVANIALKFELPLYRLLFGKDDPINDLHISPDFKSEPADIQRCETQQGGSKSDVLNSRAIELFNIFCELVSDNLSSRSKT